jgi:hypothetical protein
MSPYIIFFLFSILIRIVHFKFSGFDSFFCCDVSRYLDGSKNIIDSNYNLINDLFITAPFYPYFLAFLRKINEPNLINLIVFTQIIISSSGTIFIMKISEKIFNSTIISNLSGLIYSIYPTTLFYTHMVGQETLFQFFFIVSCYYFYKFYNKNKTKYLIAFSVFISLAILTKTIANLVFILMIISLIIFSKKKIYNSLIIILVILLVTFPYGFYNLKKNRFYVLSSTGSGLFFSMSHNDNIYNFLVEINSLGELKNKETINFYPQSYFNESLKYMSLKEKERYWFNEGMEWINDHPIKFIKMKIYNFFHFLFPGVNINHYSFSKWLISFTIALPLYFGAYISILKCLKSNFRKHLIIISTFGGMGIFSTFLMPVDRFIYITLEPILIVYFAHFIKELLFKNSYGFINQKNY